MTCCPHCECPHCGAEDSLRPVDLIVDECIECGHRYMDTSEYDEPPVRRSKSERPTHTRDGDSVKNIERIIGKRARK